MINIVCRDITSIDELEKNIDKWKQLLIETGQQSVFFDPLWHKAWWKSIGKNYDMHILVAETDDKWVGLLPLATRPFFKGKSGIASLRFSGGTQADLHDLVVYDSYIEEVVDLFHVPFEDLLKRASTVQFHAMPFDSPLLQLKKLYNHQKVANTIVSPFIDIEGLQYSQIEKTWKKSHRNDIHRQKRRLQELGDLRIEQVTTADEAKKHINKLISLLERKWERKKNLPNPKRKTSLYDYYSSLVENLWPSIHFTYLSLDKAPISYHFGFIYENRLTYYQPVYSLVYENYSPGKVHLSMILEEACHNGIKEFDFSLGGDEYKHLWSDQERKRISIIYKGEGAFCNLLFWWFYRGKPFIKSLYQQMK